MGKLQWHRRDHHEEYTETKRLSLEEYGAYARLLLLIFENDGEAEDDDRFVSLYLRCDVRVWKRVKGVLLDAGLIYISGGNIRNNRADVTVSKALATAELRGLARLGKGTKSPSKPSKTNDLDEPYENLSREDSRVLESLSTNVDNSPPIAPHALAEPEAGLGPESALQPEFELVMQESVPIQPCMALAAIGPTQRLPAKRNEYSPEFDRFWSIYPRKKAKGFAWKAWKSAMQLIEPADLISRLRDRIPAMMVKPQFIKHPATWLNARCWEDEISQHDLMPQERTGTVGAVAYLMQNGKTDAFSNEINGMSERERELLSRPAWQDALEGQTHRDDDGERRGDDRGLGRGAGSVQPGSGSGDMHGVGSSEQVVAEPVGAFGVGAGLRREAGPQGKSGAQIYAFRAA